MKKYLLLWFASCLIGVCDSLAQPIIVQASYESAGQVSAQRLWHGLVNNLTQQSLPVRALLEVRSNQILAKAESASFTLKPGNNRLEALQLRTQQIRFFDQEFEQVFKAIGGLPQHSFSVCLTIEVMLERPEQAEDCQQFIPENPIPLQLIYPDDQSTISEPWPVFSWIPPSLPKGLPGMKFLISIFEAKSGNSSFEETRRMQPIYSQNNLSFNTHLYPTSARNLQLNHRYYWQVQAYYGKYKLGISEPWMFQLAEDSLETDSLISRNPSYIDIVNSNLKEKFFGVGVLKWKCKLEKEQNYTVKILDNKKAKVVADVAQGMLQPGEQFNKHTLTSIGLKHRTPYYVQVTIGVNTYYIHMIYINPERLKP